ncbi:MAG: M23 family metallopeptidase [Methyloligella sp. ZOD6]
MIVFFIALMLLVCVALPLVFAWRLWRLDAPSRLDWLLAFASTAAFVALVMLVGRWDIAGLWTRFVLLVVLAAAAFISLRRHLRRPWFSGDASAFWRRQGSTIVTMLIVGTMLAYVLAGQLEKEEVQEFAFPLRDGHFVVAQGGAGLLNHHSSNRAQRRALDITAVNAAGFRVSGILPADPARYVVFGKTVTSPCDGSVVAARDGLPDLSPPAAARKNPAGNHVLLSCGDLQVELAHLQQGSVAVASGERVHTGEAIGKVGNSGNTTEPHLHVHAVDPQTGAGVQMVFDGVAPKRNTHFRR